MSELDINYDVLAHPAALQYAYATLACESKDL